MFYIMTIHTAEDPREEHFIAKNDAELRELYREAYEEDNGYIFNFYFMNNGYRKNILPPFDLR